MRVDGLTSPGAAAPEAVRPGVAAPRLGTAQPDARVEASKVQVERRVEEQARQAEKAPDVAPKTNVSRSRIRVDEASRRYIAQVVNENNEVIKQYPPEAILRFTARFRKLQGLLFDEQV